MSDSADPQPITSQLPPSDGPILSPISHDDKKSDISSNGGWGAVGLQPVSILSKEAQSGKFSLENILCVPDVLEPSQASRQLSGYGPAANSKGDPIRYHILTFPVALGLFERYLRKLS